jgi:predicted kinase
VLDCIEFDAGLRRDDALADVAFLAMDLERLGRPDLGERFLAAYREHAADTWPDSLAHHHVAYRAQVRAKVTAIRATQGVAAAAEEAPRLLAMARRHLVAGAVRLVVVGGLPGTGKTTVARGLGEALGATVIRSDEVRKELAGIPTDRAAVAAFGEGIYGAGATSETYREMARRACVALARGEHVVLDASFISEHERIEARNVAESTHADLVELRCTAPAEVAAARLDRRLAAGTDASDATPAVAARMAEVADPWPEALVIDTTGPPESTQAQALALTLAADR